MVFVGRAFRKVRKRGFTAGDFPQSAETCFCHGRLSAKCGSVVLLRAAFRTVRKRGFCHGRLSAPCGSVVFVGRAFRKVRKHGFVTGGFPHRAEAWFLLRAAYRKARKRGFVAGSVPQSAETRFCRGQRSAKCGNTVLPRAAFRKARKYGFVASGLSAECGNVCSDGRCGVLGAAPLGEGVAEAPQGLERGGDFPPRRLHHADFPRPAFHSSRLMKR